MVETMVVLAGFVVAAAVSTGVALADDAGASEVRRTPARPAGVRAVVTEVEIGGAFQSIQAIPLTGVLYVKKGRRYELAQGRQVPDGVPLYRRTLRGKRAVYELA